MRSLKRLVLWTARHLGLFRLARVLTRRRLRILCYHGFACADEAEFRPKMFIRPGQFLRRLDYLRSRGFTVLSLDEAARRLEDGTLPDYPVVITVDDGFRSFHDLALPLLARYRLPATAYVATYHVENQRPVFPLAVQYLIWKSGVRRLGPADLPFIADRIADWEGPGLMERIEQALIDYGEGLPAQEDRERLCHHLGARLGVSYAELAASGRLNLMSPRELADLPEAGTDVQLHTHRHVFPPHDRAAALREIEENRAALASWVPGAGRARHFCYPSGEWDPRQWAWLDAVGVRTATTCDPGLNGPDTHRLALRRFVDGAAIHPLEFEAAMSGFTEALHALRHAWALPVRERPASGVVEA